VTVGIRVLASALLSITCVWAGVTVLYRLVAWQLFVWNPSLEGCAEAVSWDPRVPDFYFQLGLIRRDHPDHQDMGESIRNLERAVALNPYRWDYLNELARAYELGGREAEAVRLYEESIRVNPRSGLYRWRLGNYYLRTRGLVEALPCFQRAVALEPSYMTPAAHLLSQVGATPEELVRICPEDTQSRLALLAILESQVPSPRQSIDLLWSEILSGTPPPTLSDGLFHLEYLERDRSPNRARETWLDLCRNSRLQDEAFEKGANFVWNGGFELPIFGIGLDWQLKQEDGYSIRLANNEGVSGSTAFRVDFTGRANPDVDVLRQKVILKSDQDYELACRIRSEALTSDQGLYVQVLDSKASRPISESVRILGTNDWEELMFRIPGAPGASETYRVLSLLVRRDRSWKIDNTLGGTLWLDDVVIKEANSRYALGRER